MRKHIAWIVIKNTRWNEREGGGGRINRNNGIDGGVYPVFFNLSGSPRSFELAILLVSRLTLTLVSHPTPFDSRASERLLDFRLRVSEISSISTVFLSFSGVDGKTKPSAFYIFHRCVRSKGYFFHFRSLFFLRGRWLQRDTIIPDSRKMSSRTSSREARRRVNYSQIPNSNSHSRRATFFLSSLLSQPPHQVFVGDEARNAV